MKKLVVRIFNVLFMGLAAYAIICFATKPLLNLEVTAVVKKEKIGELASNLGGDSDDSGEDHSGDSTPPPSEAHYVLKAEGDESSFDFTKALTPEKVEEAVGDLEIKVGINVPAKYCFDLKNEKVLNQLLDENITPVIHNLVTTVTPKFKNLVKTITKDFAKDVMTDEISKQIAANFGKDINIPEEKVNAIVDNVYAKLDKGEGETTSVSELTEVILGTTEYKKVEGLNAETFAQGTYYLLVEGEYVKAEVFEEGKEYYTAEYGDGIRGILQYVEQSGEVPTSPIDYDALNTADVEAAMTEALDNIPNLTEHPLADPQPTADNFGDATYFTKKDGLYTKTESFTEGETYYTDEVVINNINDALIGLMDFFLGGQNDSAPEEQANNDQTGGEVINEGKQESALLFKADEPASQDDRLSQKVESVIYDLLPLNDILDSDLSLGGYAPMIFFGLMILGMIPWGLFILLTLIRTIRPRKCWTKTWIILVFAFTQIIFGVGLTYGLKFAMPMLTDLIAGSEVGSAVGNIAISLETSALIPSIIYLAFIPLTIIYMILRHSVKRDFKQYKKDKKAAKHAAKAA